MSARDGLGPVPPQGVVTAAYATAAAAAARATTIGSRFGRVVLAPLGTGADDMPRLAAVEQVCAANDWPLLLLAGSGAHPDWYIATTRHDAGYDPGIPSGLKWKCAGPDVRFVSTLPASDFQHGVPFQGRWTVGPGTYDTTLHANCTIGSRVLHTHGYVPAGSWFMVGDGTNSMVGNYCVESCITDVAEAGDAGNKFSAWALSGITVGNTNGGLLYWVGDVVAGNATMSLYSDAAKTVKVAEGALVGDAGGTITLAAVGGSGLTGTVVAAAAIGTDNDGANILTTGLNAAGSWSVTCDRPVMAHVVTGDAVQVMADFAHDIELDFNGATLTGTGIHSVVFLAGRDCVVKGLRVDASAGWPTGSAGVHFNDGSFRCRAEDCSTDGYGGTGATQGHTVQNCEDCYLEKCTLEHMPANGFYATDVIGGAFTDCAARSFAGCGFGVNSTHAATADTVGFTLERCSARGCSTGFNVTLKAAETTLIGCDARYGTDSGLVLDGTCSGTIVECFTGSNNAKSGIEVNDATGTVIKNVVCNSNTLYGIELSCASAASGIRCSSNGSGQVLCATTGAVRVEDFELYGPSGTGKGFYVSSSGTLSIKGGKITANFCIEQVGTATVMHEDLECVNGAGFAYAADNYANTRIIGRNYRRSGAGAEKSLGGANCHESKGTATLDGASPSAVTIAYRGIKTGEVPKLTLITKAGTGTGLYPTVTVTAGVGFVLGSVNGDASVWAWEV